MPTLSEFYLELGKRVRNARTRAGLTQDDLAKELKLTRTSVTNIERGKQKLLVHTLAFIAQAVRVSVHDLVPEIDTDAHDLSDLLKDRHPDEKSWIERTITKA